MTMADKKFLNETGSGEAVHQLRRSEAETSGEHMRQSWQDFALAEPELSAFGETRLKSGPAYLATVRADV
ncbi:hypothetical protein [Dictyobacter halimunensis]